MFLKVLKIYFHSYDFDFFADNIQNGPGTIWITETIRGCLLFIESIIFRSQGMANGSVYNLQCSTGIVITYLCSAHKGINPQVWDASLIGGILYLNSKTLL